MTLDWLAAAERLRAIAQTGLTYAKDRFDLQRYRELEGMSLDMLAALLSSTPEIMREVFELSRGYPTPKVDVRTAVFSEGRILLVQEWLDGGWTMPGGWADEADSPRCVPHRCNWLPPLDPSCRGAVCRGCDASSFRDPHR